VDSRLELEGREKTTVYAYRVHVRCHILPRLGREKLSALTTPRINAFRDDLLKTLSRPLAKKVLTSFKSLLRDAQRRGNVAQNVALPVSIGIDRRGAKLKVGVDIPMPAEIGRIVNTATGKWRAPLVVAAFTGLRASELRGLRWKDVDLPKGLLHVRQRADRYGVIGKPKSEAGERTIPLGPFVVNTLKAWKLESGGSTGLVFPNRTGGVEEHSNLLRACKRVVRAAGIERNYGLHSLRHFYASWCINRKTDGGLELPAKAVQARLGHASIVMTLDRYGHLFPAGDSGAELAAAERMILSNTDRT
jgi:integrase